MDSFSTGKETLRSAGLSLAPFLLLLLQPLLFFWAVLVNPKTHIPFDIEEFHLPLISYLAQCVRRGVAPMWFASDSGGLRNMRLGSLP